MSRLRTLSMKPNAPSPHREKDSSAHPIPTLAPIDLNTSVCGAAHHRAAHNDECTECDQADAARSGREGMRWLSGPEFRKRLHELVRWFQATQLSLHQSGRKEVGQQRLCLRHDQAILIPPQRNATSVNAIRSWSAPFSRLNGAASPAATSAGSISPAAIASDRASCMCRAPLVPA